MSSYNVCKRCGYQWLPRIAGDKVKQCPACKSMAWKIPKPEPRTEGPEEQNAREISEREDD